MNRKSVGQADCICERCKRPLRVAERRREDSKPFRLAKVPKGVCSDCVMTQFLYNTYPINMQIDQAGPELLLKPGIRDAFLMAGLLDKCDLTIDEVNWQRVVDNWNLPIQVAKNDGRNPYRMGDMKRQAQARREAGLGDGSGLYGMFGEGPELPPGIRMSGGTLVVDGSRVKPDGKGGLADAVGGLLDALKGGDK